MLLFGKRTTANLYSHLECNAKISSAETIAKAFGGMRIDKAESDESDVKATSSNPPKKSGGRKKKSNHPNGTGESHVSII